MCFGRITQFCKQINYDEEKREGRKTYTLKNKNTLSPNLNRALDKT